MTGFKTFGPYVDEGDTFHLDLGWGYTAHATVLRDDWADGPDERTDGFWPSLDPADHGYIGDGKTEKDLKRFTKKAEQIMQAWEDDEWFYVVLIVAIEDPEGNTLEHEAVLGGIVGPSNRLPHNALLVSSRPVHGTGRELSLSTFSPSLHCARR